MTVGQLTLTSKNCQYAVRGERQRDLTNEMDELAGRQSLLLGMLQQVIRDGLA